MLSTRIIPCLLLKDGGLVKTVKFKNPTYVGDPINAIKIFNEKMADELIFIDINATVQQQKPNFEIIRQIASECFMPVCYGGGIRSIQDMETIFKLGIEKISISSYAVENPSFITEAAKHFGTQSIVVCIDVKRDLWDKYKVVTHTGNKTTALDPVEHAVHMTDLGAGEILINTVDRDGVMEGYDISLIRAVADKISVPVIACGGAGSLQHIADVLKDGRASSAAVGSLFVFYGKHRAVLINYPGPKEVGKLLPGSE